MRLKIVPSVEQKQEQRVSFLQQDWDRALFPSAENPFPLAPKDLVRMGLVTQENYDLECDNFGKSVGDIMVPELNALTKHPAFEGVVCPQIKVFGSGRARDLKKWIVDAILLPFFITVCDISAVACQILEEIRKTCPNPHKVEIVQTEAEAWLGQSKMDDLFDVPIYYMSQFIQVQGYKKMQRMMKRVVSILTKNPPTDSDLGTVLYMVHPFGKDNVGPCEWNGITFLGVEWEHTTPYDEEDLFGGLSKKMRGLLRIEILATFKYFHQTYSIVKLYCVENG